MSGWISVKDRMPEERYSVLVWCPERMNEYSAYIDSGEWYFFGTCDRMTEDVSHWMSLPQPPKEG